MTGETAEQVEHFKRDVEGICDYYNVGYTKLNHYAADAYRQMIVKGEYGKIKCCSACYETVPLTK